MENNVKTSKEDKLKFLAEVNAKMEELDDVKEVEDMIQNNIIEFPFEDKIYRLRKPDRRAKQEIRAIQNKKKNEILRDPDNVTEEELIHIYLNRTVPVDIPKMRIEIQNLQQIIDKNAILLIETPIGNIREKIQRDLEDLKIEQLDLADNINNLLSTCVEKQLNDFVQEYLIYVCLEEKVDDKWKRYYDSYDTFMDSNDPKEDDLVYKATWYFSVLINYNG